MDIARKAAARAGQYATELAVLGKAGIIRPYPPHVLFKMGRTLLQWGTGPAGGFTTLAQRAPHDEGRGSWGRRVGHHVCLGAHRRGDHDDAVGARCRRARRCCSPRA